MNNFWLLISLLCSALLVSCAPLTQNPMLRIETGMHTAAVTSIDTDFKEEFIVTSSLDKTIRVWSFDTGKLLHTIRVPSGNGLDGQLYASAISPDSNFIAAAGHTGKEFESKSIYIFDRRSGQLIKRLAVSLQAILHLEFSPNGEFLVSTHAGREGLRIWETRSWKNIFTDSNYGDNCNWADFDQTGRLVTTSDDGVIRLYSSNFELITFIRAPGGQKPYSAVFSPDDKKIAVGFSDTMNIDVVSGDSLLHLYSPDITHILNFRPYIPNTSNTMDGKMGVVSWSKDGNTLHSGGILEDSNTVPLYSWPEQGRGTIKKIPLSATNSIADLRPVENGILYGSFDASFGLVGAKGKVEMSRTPGNADTRQRLRNFLISEDGSIVQFFSGLHSEKAVQFSLHNHILADASAATSEAALTPPRLESANFGVTGWEANLTPKRNTEFIPLVKGEVSQSLSIHPEDRGFILGTTKFVRCYDSFGKLSWLQESPTNWAVNVSGNGEIVATASGDGTIHWYRWEDGEEIATLYVDKNSYRWVIWTPDGYFDHSPGGESMVGYYIYRGRNSVPLFISVDQLYEDYYRPDLILSRFLGHATAEGKKVAVWSLLEKEMPPGVQVATEEAAMAGPLVRVTVQITDMGGGIGRILYRVNDATVDVDEIQSRSFTGDAGLVELEKILPLASGDNLVQVTAFNKNNIIESKPATLRVVRKTDKVIKPNLYIIAIGINKYQDHALELSYSVNDAEELIETISRRAANLFQNIAVERIFDEAATRDNIAQSFGKFASQITSDDVFVLYMAGHGMNVDGNYYFFPWDLIYTGDESVKQGALNREDIQGLIAQIKAKKAVILLDTCNAGAFSDSKMRGLIEKTAIFKLVRATGRATIMAASDNQAALEGYNGHGVFTWALIEAINGAADTHGDNNQETAINEVAEFVMAKVPEITMEKWQYKQFPMHNLYGISFPLGLVGAD